MYIKVSIDARCFYKHSLKICNLREHIYKSDIIGNMIDMATLMIHRAAYAVPPLTRGILADEFLQVRQLSKSVAQTKRELKRMLKSCAFRTKLMLQSLPTIREQIQLPE